MYFTKLIKTTIVLIDRLLLLYTLSLVKVILFKYANLFNE